MKIFRNLTTTCTTTWLAKPLLSALSLIVLFTACERDDLELGLPPNDSVFEVRYSEQTFEPKMFWNDTVNSTVSNRLLVGSYEDDYFGEVSASSYFSLSPINFRPPVLFDGYSVDSVVLTFRYDYVFNDERVANLDLRLWTLESPIPGNSIFNTYDKMVPDQLVGTYVDNYNIDRLRNPYFLQDTTHYIRVFLNTDYGKYVLDSIDNTPGLITETEEDLHPIIPGFALIPGGDSKGVFGFLVGDMEARFTIYYTEVSGSQNQVNYAISQVQHFNHITPNVQENEFSTTVAANMVQPNTEFDPGGDYVYFQSGTGMGISFDVEKLQSIGDTIENFMVNKAILELQNVAINSNVNGPPANLKMLLTDDSHEQKFFNNRQRVVYQNSRSDSIALISSSFPASATFEPLNYIVSEEKYQGDLTFFVQGLLEGRGDLTKIMLYDVDVSANKVSSFRVRKDDIKIRIFYTKSRL